MSERLKKVTSFGDIKIGQIVVVKDCRACGRSRCRSLVIRFDRCAKVLEATGDVTIEAAFRGVPNCCPQFSPMNILAVSTVSEGRLFVVDDGLSDRSVMVAAQRTVP